MSLAKQSTDARPRKDTLTRTRFGLKVTQLLEQPASRAYGKQTPSFADTDWNSADVGMLLAGLGSAQTLAALYAWAGATQNYLQLRDELMKRSLALRREFNWPWTVRNMHGQAVGYLDRLCEMVLDEDRYPGVLDYAPVAGVGQDDQTGILRAIYCDVTLPVWKRHLAERYAGIRGVWIGWLDEAARRAQARLRDDE